MIPQSDQTWFFKVTGPESAVDGIAATFRKFVETVEFNDGAPILDDLPGGWQRAGGSKPFRYASINIETPEKQLDLSISNLARQEDWDQEVAMNINRWRGQLGLSESTEKWAERESIKVASADDNAIWVDLVGTPSSGGPPMMGSNDERPNINTACRHDTSPTERITTVAIQIRDARGLAGREESSMRWASFKAGPEDSTVDVSVIPAGGDTRGNVDRWIRQILRRSH